MFDMIMNRMNRITISFIILIWYNKIMFERNRKNNNNNNSLIANDNKILSKNNLKKAQLKHVNKIKIFQIFI